MVPEILYGELQGAIHLKGKESGGQARFILKFCLHNEYTVSSLFYAHEDDVVANVPRVTNLLALQYLLSHDTSYIQIFC